MVLLQAFSPRDPGPLEKCWSPSQGPHKMWTEEESHVSARFPSHITLYDYAVRRIETLSLFLVPLRLFWHLTYYLTSPPTRQPPL